MPFFARFLTLGPRSLMLLNRTETLATQATEGPIPFPYCSQISPGELSQSQSALVSGTGTRDEPIRTVAGEAKYTIAKSIYLVVQLFSHIKSAKQIGRTIALISLTALA